MNTVKNNVDCSSKGGFALGYFITQISMATLGDARYGLTDLKCTQQ